MLIQMLLFELTNMMHWFAMLIGHDIRTLIAHLGRNGTADRQSVVGPCLDERNITCMEKEFAVAWKRIFSHNRSAAQNPRSHNALGSYSVLPLLL
jgi:hypothetical protein